MILEEKLRQELDKNKILLDTQAGFRKNRSIIDNICILNYAIEKEISKKERRIYVFFTDLKAAFDIMNRKKLWAIMKRKGINRHLIRKIEEIMKKTINIVLDGIYTKEFWTNRRKTRSPPELITICSIYSRY